MAHGFSGAEDLRGEVDIDIPYGKIFKFLKNNLWRLRKQQENIAVRVNEIQNTLEGRPQNALPPGTRMLSGKDPKGLISSGGPTALPPGGPRLPGDTGPIGPKKGGTITNLSGDGGINSETFFKRAQSGVGADGTYMTNAQRKEAFIKSRQERVKESVASAAAVSKSPEISADKSSDIVAAVNKNTEAVLGLVKVTKEQTSNDTKLTERQTSFQEKMFSRQQASAEENSLERQSIRHGFSKSSLEKYEKKVGAGPGGQGYSGQLGRSGPNVMDMLDIGSDILDMRKGKVRRITQGRDGRTSRQRLRDMKARKAGLRPSSRGVRPSGGVRPRGGGLPRTGGGGLNRGAGLAKALTGGAKGSGLGGLKGAAKGFGKAGPLALLTAGLEFGDRMASGQNALQAGVGTAGSVGGGLAGAAAGAAIGSVVPILGTAVGGLLGGWLGSMAGGGLADAATGANNVTAMASGGVLVGEAGLEGVFPLSGKEGLKTFTMFGEGLFNYQKDNKNEFAKLQSAGMKQYYENEGGFEKMGEGLGDVFKGVTDALGGIASGLGSVLSSLAGGSASAATLSSGAGAYLTDNTVEGNKRAILASIKAAGYDDQAAANMLAQIEGESGFKMQSELSYENTSVANIKRAMGDRVNHLSDDQIEILKKDPEKFFNEVYSSSTMTESERMGNAVGEGFKYRGRGFIQLTGKNNYRKIGNLIGVDLVNNPDLMNDPSVAAKASVAYFQSVGANNQNMSTMTGAYNAVYRGNANTTRLDRKDRQRVTARSQRASQFLSQMQSGQLTAQTQTTGATQGPSGQAQGLTGSGAIYPMPGKSHVTHGVGLRNGKQHHGTDIVETPEGGKYRGDPRTPILAMADGEVIADPTNNFQKDAYLAGVMVRHPSLGVDARYLHMNPYMKPGTPVKRGQVIGSLVPIASGDDPYGNTHLHLELYKQGTSENLGNAGRDRILGGSQRVAMSQIGPGGIPSAGLASLPAPGQIASAPGQPARQPASSAFSGIQTPAPPPATPAAANTGTQMMTTSAQVANGQVASAQPIVINNYYTGVGGGQTAQMVPNSLNAGISMDSTGLAAFQQLRLRSLG